MISPKNLVRVTLVIIALHAAYSAVADPTSRPFTTTIAAVAIVLLALVSLSRFDWKPPRDPRSSTPQRKRLGAIVFMLSVLAGAIVLVVFPWQDSGDFDLSGVLFLILNALPLLLTGGCLVGAVIGFAMWRGWA